MTVVDWQFFSSLLLYYVQDFSRISEKNVGSQPNFSRIFTYRDNSAKPNISQKFGLGVYRKRVQRCSVHCRQTTQPLDNNSRWNHPLYYRRPVLRMDFLRRRRPYCFIRPRRHPRNLHLLRSLLARGWRVPELVRLVLIDQTHPMFGNIMIFSIVSIFSKFNLCITSNKLFNRVYPDNSVFVDYYKSPSLA